MDIDVEFEKIINKYNVDTLGRQIYFEDAISEVVEKYSKFDNIALRGAGMFTEAFLDFFSDKIKIKAIFDKNPNNVSDKIISYGIPVLDISELDKSKWDVVIISTTKKYIEEIRYELKNYNIKYIVDLCDEVEKLYGMRFDSVFTYSNGNAYLYIIGASSRYRKSKDNIEKEKLLKNIISSFLYNRDVFAVNRCIDEYIDKKYTDWEKYKNFREELNELMDTIKGLITNRKHKDVIILWQDNLMYNWVENMPFEKSCRDKGLFFENARGVTVWTRAAMKAVLDKRLDIDNYYFQDNNDGHLLTKFYIENGYTCKYINSDGESDLHKNKAVENQKTKRTYSPMSLIYWNLLKCLLSNKEPVMAIVHSIIESHWPNCSPNLEDFSVMSSNYESIVNNKQNWEYKMKNVVKYIDKETEYFINFLNDESIKIIMSDHGQMTSEKSRKWDYDAMHINFIVFGGDIKPKRCTDLFSITNFYELSKYILEPNIENFSNIFISEVPYQACPMYNENLIRAHIENDFEEWGIAYRGLESINDRYILMETGQEIYNRLPDEKTNYINNERFKERIDYLRKKTGNNFIDITKEPQFKYSHLLYDSLREKGRLK